VAGVRDPHVTLCFLGEVDDGLVPAVVEALRSGLDGLAPCEAALAEGPARRLGPTAVVRAVSGLDEVAVAVRRAVGRFAARPEARPFHGHLTVARRPRGTSVPGRADGQAEVRWSVEEVLLVRSELGRGQGGRARHTAVAVVRLTGSGSRTR